MIIHSDSFPGVMLNFLVCLGTAGGLLASTVLLLALKTRQAAKVFVVTLAVHSTCLILIAAGLVLASRTIVKVGDSYCYDSWCAGVTNVTAAPHAQDVVYKVDVRIFSDAGRGKQRARGPMVLIDDRGRRFPMVADALSIPLDSELDPGQAIDTTLTFDVPADAHQLFLMYEEVRSLPFVLRALTGLWVAEIGEKYLSKEPLLRVM